MCRPHQSTKAHHTRSDQTTVCRPHHSMVSPYHTRWCRWCRGVQGGAGGCRRVKGGAGGCRGVQEGAGGVGGCSAYLLFMSMGASCGTIAPWRPLVPPRPAPAPPPPRWPSAGSSARAPGPSACCSRWPRPRPSRGAPRPRPSRGAPRTRPNQASSRPGPRPRALPASGGWSPRRAPPPGLVRSLPCRLGTRGSVDRWQDLPLAGGWQVGGR